MADSGRLLERFEDWWRGQNEGLPLMRVVAVRDGSPFPPAASEEAFYTDVPWLTARFEAEVAAREYLFDAYPSLSVDLGPGSMALYLGSEPRFAWDTVWFSECMSDLEAHPPLRFDPDNRWWRRHLQLLSEAVKTSSGRYRVNIPDIIENIDILAAMRGPQNTLYDLMDSPELVHERLRQIQDAYFSYYDACYDLTKASDGTSSYTAFHIVGRGRVAKLQCDFSAMLSPKQFREFVLPSLRDQTEKLDHTLYHLDGPSAIRHVPALMELERLNALQWTCGAGQPDGGSERWYPIYDQVIAAGKGLWIMIYDGDVYRWAETAEKLLSRYDYRKLYFIFPDMPARDAEYLAGRAENRWLSR